MFARALRPGDRVGLFWLYYYFLCPLSLGATVVVLPDTAFLDPHEARTRARAQLFVNV